MRPFLDKNAEVLTHDINNLADATNTLVQPDPLNGLETALHVLPTRVERQPDLPPGAQRRRRPSRGRSTNFANPMQFICSAIQAGSRLGYQESAELCAQYLAPILDAIKFNYPPFGAEPVQHRGDAAQAGRLFRATAAAAHRLQGHDGAGHLVPDTPFSHGNTEHGWITAPGMQGVKVQPFTAGMLTPESLAELMGGPDIAPVQSQYLQTPPGPPNAYNEQPAPPPLRYPQPGADPPPPPGPGVIPGPGRADARTWAGAAGAYRRRRDPRCPLRQQEGASDHA